MHSLYSLGVLAFYGSLAATAQILAAANGSCSVSATGLMSCDWISALTIRGGKKTEPEKPTLLVTRYSLAPGAPLRTSVAGDDAFIVGIGDGELANETKSPQTLVGIRHGSVALLPREETYLLRNIGKETLELLLVEVRR